MWVAATFSYHQEQLWASQWGYKQKVLGFLGGPERGLLEVLHGRPGASGAPKAHDPQARWSWITTRSRMKPTGWSPATRSPSLAAPPMETQHRRWKLPDPWWPLPFVQTWGAAPGSFPEATQGRQIRIWVKCLLKKIGEPCEPQGLWRALPWSSLSGIHISLPFYSPDFGICFYFASLCQPPSFTISFILWTGTLWKRQVSRIPALLLSSWERPAIYRCRHWVFKSPT